MLLSTKNRHCFSGALLSLIFLPAMQISTAHAEDQEGYLEQYVPTPDWLTLSGGHRTRFEFISDQSTGTGFARGRDLGVISLRSNILAEAKFGRFRIGAELMDSRAYTIQGNLDAVADSTFDTLEPIQFYVAADFENLITDGDIVEIKAGRFTMDLGSRRLIARADFRNTVDTFYGLQGTWSRPGVDQLTVFYTLPEDDSQSDENDFDFDEPEISRQFLGAHYARSLTERDLSAELYTYVELRPGLLTFPGSNFTFTDDSFGASEQRITLGARIFRPQQTAGWDFDFEATGQYQSNEFSIFGNSGFAFFTHGEIGYTFDNAIKLRVAPVIDIASGLDTELEQTLFTTQSPVFDDFGNVIGEEPTTVTALNFAFNGLLSFDPLFGVVMPDFGTEGVFQIFSRSNELAPGIKFSAQLSKKLTVNASYRASFRLQSAFVGDPFNFPALQPDDFEELDSFAGHALQTEWTYDILKERVFLNFGGALFLESDNFLDNNFATIGEQVDDGGQAYYGFTSINVRF